MTFRRKFRGRAPRRRRPRAALRGVTGRLFVESLETRLLLTGTPLAFTSAGGDITLRSIGGDYEIVDSQDAAQVFAQQAAATTSQIEINATGDSHLTIEFDANAPLPVGGVAYLAQTQNFNSLSLAGSVGSVVYSATDAHDGSIVVADSLSRTIPITYAGLSPIYDNLNLASRTFQFDDGGSPETITLSDAGAGQMTLTSTNAESVTFSNPASALAIVEAGGAADNINVASVNSDFTGALSIIGGSGANTIGIQSPLALQSLAITAAGAGSMALLDADVSTAGTQTYDAPVVIAAARTLTSNAAGEAAIAFDQDVSLGTAASGPATLTLEGNAAFAVGSSIAYQLDTPGGAGGQLEVDGDLQLSAELRIQGLAGFAPGAYRLVDYAGTLASSGLALAALPDGFAANIGTATTGQVNLQVARAGSTPGDVNGDGTTNGLDIALISSNWLHQGAFALGDANHDGVVNGLDISAVASHWLKQSSLVAAYSFNEDTGNTVFDASGRGNTGTIAAATWTTGKTGSALSFDGDSAQVTIPDSSSLDLSTGMTLEAWVNPTGSQNAAWGDVIYKYGDAYYLEGTSTQDGVPAVGGSFAPDNAFGVDPLTPGTWSYLAATYDGSTLRLYVNGNEVASVPEVTPISPTPGPLSIGGDSEFGQFFAGLIDDVRIYNAALTPAQIQTDMITPVGNPVHDTLPPSAPTGLTAQSVDGQVALNWTAATDNVGVSDYLIERQDSGGAYTQIGITAETSYVDTSITTGVTYSYRVRAVDAADNLGPYSSTVTVTPGFAVSPHVVTLTIPQTQQFTADANNVVWSVDGIVGGSADVGTISPTGLYTPAGTSSTHSITATGPGGAQSDTATVYLTDYAGTFTYHNDNMGTGQNLDETVLTPANVNSSSFGKVFSFPLDGYSFASPLYVPHVNIPGQGIHNVVYIATEHDTVYAYDADGQSTTPLWKDSFIDPANGITTVPTYDTGEVFDIPNEIGITGTPVIDPATNTMYVAAATKQVVGDNVSYAETLYAIDITTGAEKLAPVVIQGSVPGTGAQSDGGVVTFEPLLENQRPALLLSNGVVYVGFGTHGNPAEYHGWLFGYSATTLQQVMIFCTTPDADKGGIWQAGGGPTADADGNIYFVTGNGDFDAASGGDDYGDTAIKLSPSGTVLDSFTPHDQATLDQYDIDMGSGGVLLLPDQPGPDPHEMIVCGKAGSIYVLNRDDLGGYDPNDDDSQVVQYLPNIFPGYSYDIGNRITPVYFNGTVYFSADADNMKAFSLTNGVLSTTPTSQTSEVYQYPGGAMSISANGDQNGILWAVQCIGSSPGVLHAYDASNLGNELYNSAQVPARDTMDAVAKFSAPLVANGRVYVGGATEMTVYGLLSEPDEQ